MGVSFNLESGAQNKSCAACKILPLTVAIFIIVLSISAGNAWSFDRSAASLNLDNPDAVIDFSRDEPSSSTMAEEQCLPHLQSIRQATSVSAMDRNQRAAGKAAALGLVLGVRFALSPTPNKTPAKAHVDVWQPSYNSANAQRAIAIADYRACLKEHALKSSMDAIGEFRWTR